jgi:hypothetical protein
VELRGSSGTRPGRSFVEEKGGQGHPIGSIVYTFVDEKLSRRQRDCEVTAQRHRIVQPVKPYDENKDVYNLTRVFIDEFLRHPFANDEGFD